VVAHLVSPETPVTDGASPERCAPTPPAKLVGNRVAVKRLRKLSTSLTGLGTSCAKRERATVSKRTRKRKARRKKKANHSKRPP